MLRYIVMRVGQGIVTLFVMSIAVFFLVRLTGNPVDLMLPLDASDRDRATMTARLGLDRPPVEQYWYFVSQAVRGDFGESTLARRPALVIILERFPATAILAILSLVISLLIAVPLGVLAATRRGSWIDGIGEVFAVLGQSMPAFWLGIVLILVFSVNLKLFPVAGQAGPGSYVLPALTMGWYTAAGIMRVLRSSMLDSLDSEYVKMARISGLSEVLVVGKYALRNAVIPVLTFTAIILGGLLAGSVVTETVFAWPGVGFLALQSFMWRDFPVIQALVLVMGAIMIGLNLLVDVLYAYVDPRLRR